MSPVSIQEKISDALRRQQPLEALKRYEEARASAKAEALGRQFGGTMDLIAAARDIDITRNFRTLSQFYANARRPNRTRILIAVVHRLIELAEERATLRQIGESLSDFVLEGTLQQQFCCKLAARMGLAGSIPAAVHEVLDRLVPALIVVLRVGAPTTRDAAVEGLGAILKIVGGDASTLFPLVPPPVRKRVANEDETDAEYAARVVISDKYYERLKRRRLIVLTIAGHSESRMKFERRLEGKLDSLVANHRDGGLEDVLYERQDLLRFLPGIARQSGDPMIKAWTAELLREAASLRDVHGNDSVIIAFSRFQESVFRTIDTAVRRRWDWSEFDEEVGAAVRAIPRTMAGAPAVCNARIRATVAILRTAIQIVKVSDGKAHRTTDAVRARFAELRDGSLWSNHGIVEGCYRGLPQLVADPIHDDLTTPGLEALFAHLAPIPRPGDLIATHRRLVANSCFRRLLVTLTDELQERQLFESEAKALLDEQRIDHDIRAILRMPAPDTLRAICQEQHAPSSEESGAVEVAVNVIEGIMFENELLHRSARMFSRWNIHSLGERVLLTRILAAQLHAISRDAPEVARDEILATVFLDTPTASLRDDTAMPLVWNLLSSIPADAADAVDAEIQRFTEYRGRQGRETGDDDLPGYVLAMIAPMASSRIAGAIAREADLNRRRDPQDFAKALYQVIMRGPHESIFDHLLPRLDEDDSDRQLVLLFRKYVARILHSGSDLTAIRRHIKSLVRDLKDTDDPTLVKLRDALHLYRRLVSNTSSFWKLLENGEVTRLFDQFDLVAAETEHARDHRKDLKPLYERKLTDLQREVGHYLSLPVSNFRARIVALERARDIADDVTKSLNAQRGLQPPERIVLVTLMQHFSQRFRCTVRWYCEEPARRIAEDAKDEKAKDWFWFFFCDRRTFQERQEDLETRARQLGIDPWERAELQKQIRILQELRRENPPRFATQIEQFEEFFINWRAANLDVDSLKGVLRERWPRWFQTVYGLITSFWWTTLLVVLPCAWSVTADVAGMHWLEGAGFFVLSLAMLVGAVLSLTPLVHSVAKLVTRRTVILLALLPCPWFLVPAYAGIHWLERVAYFLLSLAFLAVVVLLLAILIHMVTKMRAPSTSEQERRGYWFTAMLPRLARLTAVPMALIVEFDHSYEFPLDASTWVLMLLMGLSFLTTRFFVTREIVDKKEKPGIVHITPAEKNRVRQIVALALSHSFGIAVLLASIFASTHERTLANKHGEEQTPTANQHVPAPEPTPPNPDSSSFLRRFDEVPRGHRHERFLGLVPRDVTLDFGAIAERWHHPLPADVAAHLKFNFYPTIILTWTALGLFFGVFLEGFMKGARLRGSNPSDAETEE